MAEKPHDIVGLYLSLLAHAIVLSVDEKHQNQALDRTQRRLPLNRSRGAIMTHDYKRNGTTTLFVALNIVDGAVMGRKMQRHRHEEFIRFLNAADAELPADKAVHVILDNYETHKHPKVRAWLARPSTMDLPLRSDVLFVAECRRGPLRQGHAATPENGVFHSAVDLQAAINRFIKEHNQQPRPFVWKAAPDQIIAAVRRGHQTLKSIH